MFLSPDGRQRRRHRGLRLPCPLWTTVNAKNSPGSGFALLCALALAACAGDQDGPRAVSNCLGSDDAFIEGRLYGSLDAEVDWKSPALDCEGMPRPKDSGLRLRFAQPIVPTGEDLVIIIGIDGVGRDEMAEGRPATVTIIDEHRDRFFSNSGEQCWADVLAQATIAGAPTSRSVSGRVYCTTALAAVSGNGSVSLQELEFRGRVDWPDERAQSGRP